MSFHTLQIHGLSANKFKGLMDRLGHHGLVSTPDSKGLKIVGQDLACHLSHDPATRTLTVEIHQVPTLVTPGHLLGRLYDEILNTPEV